MAKCKLSVNDSLIALRRRLKRDGRDCEVKVRSCIEAYQDNAVANCLFELGQLDHVLKNSIYYKEVRALVDALIVEVNERR